VQPFAAMSSLLMMVPFYDVAGGNERLSFLVSVLITIFLDMGWFMVIVLFVIVVLAYTFMLLAPESDEYSRPTVSVFTAWKLYLLGDFDGDVYSVGASRTGIFYASTLGFNLVITNAVIALMGDSWEKTQQKKTLSAIRAKAKLLFDFERSMGDATLNDENLFPKWVHVIYRAVPGKADAEEDEWQGGLDDARRKIEKKIERKMEAMESKMESNQSKMESKMEAMESKMESKMEKIGETLAMIAGRLAETTVLLPVATLLSSCQIHSRASTAGVSTSACG